MSPPAALERLLRTTLPPALSLPVDVSLVVLFVLIGRRSHENGYALSGLLLAILPFLVGLLAGWALIRWRSGDWPRQVGHGVTLAFVTVVVALLVRPVMGQSVGDGVAGVLTFGAVALAFLLLALAGWRAGAAYLESRRHP
jgi:multisubunit Na+/H+ antiporter MnhF subunit